MSDNIDPAGIREACMADLSRARQEELPLSDAQRRGPSFAPGTKNGTDHYGIKLKNVLGSKWGAVVIDDEESRQTEGLQIENARPWAKHLAREFMEIPGNRAAAAPPRRSQGQQHSTQRSVPVPQNAPRLPARPIARPRAQLSSIDAGRNGQATQRQRQLAPKSIPAASAVVKTTATAPAPHVRAVVADPRPAPPVATPALQSTVSSLPEVPSEPGRSNTVQEPKIDTVIVPVMSGDCKVFGRDGAFVAKFTLAIDTTNNHGSLTLSAPGKGERTNLTSELEEPQYHGDAYCRVISKINSDDYRLELRSEDDALEFIDCIHSLQAAAKMNGNNQGIQDQVATNQNAVEQTTTHLPEGEPAKGHEVSSAAATQDTFCTASTGESEVAVPQDNGVLIDLTEDDPIEEQDAPAGGMDEAMDAAAHLVRLVLQMTPYLAKAGLGISRQVLRGCHEAVMENWMQQNFLESKDGETKQEYLLLIDLYVKMKLREYYEQLKKSPNGMALAGELENPGSEAQPREAQPTETQSSPPQPAVTAAPATLQEEEKPVRRQYSAAEMEAINKGKAMPPPKEVAATKFPVQNATLANRASVKPPTKGTSAILNHKDWIYGQEAGRENSNPTGVTMANGSGGSNMAASPGFAPSVTSTSSVSQPQPTLATPNVPQPTSTVSSPASKGRGTAVPVTKGLSHSRFATEPTDFAGNFTSARN